MSTTGKRIDDPVPQRSGSNLPKSYAFVMNVSSLREPVNQLAEGHELRRATVEETAAIKETLEAVAGFTRPGIMCLWECEWPHRGGLIRRLPEAEWRYFVVSFSGPNTIMADLQNAFDLATVEVEVAFTHVYSPNTVGPGVTWNPNRLFHLFEEASIFEGHSFVKIGSGEVAEIATIHTQLQTHNSELINLRHLLVQLGQLKELPHKSPLRFLGYFALLESLLTHTPKATDPYDSITRQIKKKVALLDHRWPRAIDYRPFGGGNPETIWGRMYDCRSVVAHGGVPDFTRELAALKSFDHALRLVKETTKAVARHALAEPQLLIDLREC